MNPLQFFARLSDRTDEPVSKWMVCEGAATSEACAMSPREFFGRGAALALQSFTRGGRYKPDADILFYGVRDGAGGHCEYDVGEPVVIELSDRARAHNKFRLVCDPLYRRNRHLYPSGCISISGNDAEDNNSYDVWDVSRYCEPTHATDETHANDNLLVQLPPGKYVVEVEGITYHENAIDANLRLRITRAVGETASIPAKASKPSRGNTSTAMFADIYTFDVPLTSCGPSNIVLLDLDVAKERVWKPQPGRIQLPESASDSQLAIDLELEQPPAAKRQRIALPSADHATSGRRTIGSQLPQTVPKGELSVNQQPALGGSPGNQPQRHSASATELYDSGWGNMPHLPQVFYDQDSSNGRSEASSPSSAVAKQAKQVGRPDTDSDSEVDSTLPGEAPASGLNSLIFSFRSELE